MLVRSHLLAHADADWQEQPLSTSLPGSFFYTGTGTGKTMVQTFGRWLRRMSLAWLLVSSSVTVLGQTDSQVVINPIQVCDDNGFNCGNPNRELFLDEADKIWSQAGIDVKFLDWKEMFDSTYVNDADFSDLRSAPGNQEIGGDVINMWFVNSIEGGPFGVAGGGETIIGNNVFSFGVGAGRRDTISHEIGHVLGLPHTADNDPLNLMTAGGARNAATSLGQIFPTGSMKSQLTEAQISISRNSSKVNFLDFSIPGDANLDNVVNELDVDAFIAGWRHQQQDPDIESWKKGDFNLDAITDLRDAFILHQALEGNSAAMAQLSTVVPEPSAGLLTVVGLGALFVVRRYERR